MTREEFEKMLRTLEGDALEVLDGEVDGLDPSSPFNPGFDEDATEEDIESLFEDNYYYNFEVVVEGSSGKVGVSGTFAVQDGYVDRIECLNVYDLKGLPDDADVTDGVKIADDSPEMLVVYDRLAELLQA
jgi:hypothetical protein